jgi:FkbM family methyltransferase
VRRAGIQDRRRNRLLQHATLQLQQTNVFDARHTERLRVMPQKSALVEAVREHLPGYAPDMIFDVGANNGATAIALAAAFPAATIYAFEPVAATFKTLVENVSAHDRIRPFNLALGRKSGPIRMRIKSVSVSNRIAGWRDLFKPSEVVTMTSGDGFCAEHKVQQIGFLKIDAEGHDLQVLYGFRKMLKAMRIDLVEAEVGMNPENRRHVPFEAVKHYLERLGYRLFLIYEQSRDVPFTGRPILRRSNVVFASARLIEATRL